MHNKHPGLGFPVLLTILIGGARLALAGPLAPPLGAIQPTSRFSPRVEIDQLPFTVAVSGSYYLGRDLTGVAGSNGITIAADNVTLDLGGFSLFGVAGSLDGVAVPAAQANLSIHGGTVRGWGVDGVDCTLATNCALANLQASSNAGHGLRIGIGGLVSKCTARENILDGVNTGAGVTVLDCTMDDNGDDGISAGVGCTVRSCTAYSNDDSGITTGGGSTVIGCTTRDNGGGAATPTKDGIAAADGSSVIDCVAYSNDDDGILVTAGSTVRGCTATSNLGDGIQAANDCLVQGNTCDGNGAGVNDGAGIHVTDGDTRVIDNHVTDNDRGIDVDLAGSLIIRNSAAGNTVAFDIAPGNDYGQIILSPGAGFNGAATDSNPWANFEF